MARRAGYGFRQCADFFLAVSAVDSFLAEAENGVSIFGVSLDLPAGTRIVVSAGMTRREIGMSSKPMTARS